MVVQQALALAVARRAKPPDVGVHFTPPERVLVGLEACLASSLDGIGKSSAFRLEFLETQTCGQALRLSTVQLQNTLGTTLGAQIAAMVRGYSRYRLK